MEPLYKEKDQQIDGGNGLWGLFNNIQRMTCSEEGYMLAIARPEQGRLDEMSMEEETRFWDFAFTSAAQGLKSSSHRGTEKFPPLKPAESCSVICALNDGIAAWQNVGTTHAHIVWLPEYNEIGDLQKRLNDDRKIFAKSEETYLPLAATEVVLTPANYAQDIRAARQTLREQFQDNAEDVGFSLYTRKASMTDPRNGNHMVVEAWKPGHDSVGSLSQFIRYWNGLWESPITQGGIGLRYSAFIRN